ncbi:hypothetical protein L211DRAFT_229987 [Terfezia boudieri ATCC MYA-4762]|uniref:Uncharacterized protein n=1 Tax=Terfezia boudieri ATCC MYA-4762 TaxID=1051890 RepID=A0A3N4M0S1_9PEZI|nr:hypothetical protein L211DRAFT_229987 [Terfezia boudieri ATCC MYA-4762]
MDVTDKGIQASMEMEDASIQSISIETEEVEVAEVLEEAIEKKREKKESKERSKGMGKRKERAKDSRPAGDTPPAKNKIQEDVEMLDEGRFSPYEDVSDYGKEVEEVMKDEAPVTPPVTKKSPPNAK